MPAWCSPALAVTLVLVTRPARLDRAQGPCDLAVLPAGELKADVRPGGQPSWQAPASWRPHPSLCPVRLFRFLTMLVAAIVLHKRVMRAVQRAWAV
jgi:hypothetical protein